MSESISCVSCDFLQVQTFNSSLSPCSLSNGISEDEEHDDSPYTRYIIQYGKTGCRVSSPGIKD